MKYSIVTFGCRVNQADSQRLDEAFRACGAVPASVAAADLVVVNTCSVTATADQGARQTMRRIARDNPAAKIVVTGCYATRRPDEVAALPSVIRVIRNEDKEHLVSGLAVEFGLTTADRFGDGDGSCGAVVRDNGRTAYTLRVQTGCDERCAYCIIPSTRGPGKSLSLAAVLAEVDRLEATGFKEIVLTGVHLGSYGRDLSPSPNLVELLRALDRHRSEVAFRISSLEPMDCTREIVDLVAESGRFAPHFHLPLQHASHAMLRAMGRPYTLDYYRALVDGIRERLPHASIGSDAIVGFPGESAADFETTLAYLSGSPLTYVHVFPYSDRPGTAASAMFPKVDGPTIRVRAREIRRVGERLSRVFRESQVGTVRPGLTIEDGSRVVTDNYLKVSIPPGCVRNEWVKVKILGAGESMTGAIVGA